MKLFLITMVLVILPGLAIADGTRNDNFEDAELVTEDFFEGSVHEDTDPADWFMILVPPNSNAKLTIRLVSFNVKHHLNVGGYLDKQEPLDKISMKLTMDHVSETDRFENDGSEEVDLYIVINGTGTYEFDLFYERQFAGGCFSYLGFLFIPVLGALVLIPVYTRYGR